jgi:hypothetical protein
VVGWRRRNKARWGSGESIGGVRAVATFDREDCSGDGMGAVSEGERNTLTKTLP